jgi:hypothetical protein
MSEISAVIDFDGYSEGEKRVFSLQQPMISFLLLRQPKEVPRIGDLLSFHLWLSRLDSYLEIAG